MGKYDKLGSFLRAQAREEVPMTFAEIERVIGAKLPPRAQFHRAWWSNNPANNVMTKVWRDAGYLSERVDVGCRTVVFRRSGNAGKRAVPTRASGLAEEARDYKPAEPLEEPRRHPAWGSMKGTFTIDPAWDPASPMYTDEEWGEIEKEMDEDWDVIERGMAGKNS